MSQDPKMLEGSLPSEAWNQLERILERFENVWRRGERPNLDEYLAEAEPAQRRALLVELVQEDLHYRLQAGEAARLESYLERYPEGIDVLSQRLRTDPGTATCGWHAPICTWQGGNAFRQRLPGDASVNWLAAVQTNHGRSG